MTVLVPCRNAADEETWNGPARLAKAAKSAGWTVRVTYAQAEFADKAEQPYQTESIAVRMRRAPLAAGAMWVDGKFDHAWVWSSFTQARKIGARELAKFVKEVAP